MKFYKLSDIGYPVKIHKFYILLFALCFYNIAYGQNQPITVSMKNQPLLKVFEIIEDQTDFSIAYNQTKLDVKQKVSANFVREAVSSVLNSVLKGTGFTYRQEGKHIIIIPVPAKAEAAPNNTTSTQQSIKIRGTVTDAQGEPLIGANVLVDGSKQATITDMNGGILTGSACQQQVTGYLYRLRHTRSNSQKQDTFQHTATGRYPDYG